MFWHFYQSPRPGEVYNVGGSRHANCSMIEAIKLCENISGKKLPWTYLEDNRIGDHIWWISDIRKFKSCYPGWDYAYNLEKTISDIHEGLRKRL
jgi:CDP-paratose 2-epimerase